MNESFIDRLDTYMKYAGLNDNKVTVQCGITVGLINSARKRGKSLSGDNIGKILCAYKDLDARWLLTGEGQMLQNSIEVYSDSENLSVYLERENKELKSKNEQLNRELGKLEGQIIELKKLAQEGDNATCAIASG